MSIERLILGTRKIHPNPRSLTGFIVSRRGYAIEAESKLERNAYRILDLRPDVIHITAQPDLGIGYIPDSLTETTDEDLLVEVKYESELVAKWEKLFEKFQLEEDFCRSNNLRLSFVTDYIVNEREEDLVGVLAGIRSQSGTLPDERMLESFTNLLSGKDSITVRDLLEQLGSLQEANRWVPQVCKFIWMGEAFVVSVPRPCFLDTIIAPKDRPPPLAVFSLDRLRRRVESHPLRHTGGFRIAN